MAFEILFTFALGRHTLVCIGERISIEKEKSKQKLISENGLVDVERNELQQEIKSFQSLRVKLEIDSESRYGEQPGVEWNLLYGGRFKLSHWSQLT